MCQAKDSDFDNRIFGQEERDLCVQQAFD
jgi:hypothetical protein